MAMSKAKKKKEYYTHIPTGTVWELVKSNPITLVDAFGKRGIYVTTKRPTKITFSRDYKNVTEM